MTGSRRAFLRLAAGAAAVPTLPWVASAQAYPTRPVHIVVGLGPGSMADIAARLIGQRLSEQLGQPFVIDDRGGAGGALAAESVVRAPADGYTLHLINSADTANAALRHNKLKFNIISDIAPVARFGSGPLVMVVNPSYPTKTVPEFIAHAKANPGKINFGSSGIGSLVQLAGELFKAQAGVNLIHVPYRGMVPALTDLLGGQVQVVFSTLPPALEHIKAGRLRALAVTSATRYEALPDVPTIGDFLPDYEASFALGLGAPKNAPAEIIDTLNKETNTALADPAIKAKLASLSFVPSPMTPAAYGKLIANEIEKWSNLIRTANIKIE